MVTIDATGFQWDNGNLVKCQQHGVTIETIEAVFASGVIVLPDAGHSQDEPRYRAIGKTETGKMLFVVYTLRQRGMATLIRPISARYMHQKEVQSYEKEDSDV